jgi:hypothetical protein
VVPASASRSVKVCCSRSSRRSVLATASTWAPAPRQATCSPCRLLLTTRSASSPTPAAHSSVQRNASESAEAFLTRAAALGIIHRTRPSQRAVLTVASPCRLRFAYVVCVRLGTARLWFARRATGLPCSLRVRASSRPFPLTAGDRSDRRCVTGAPVLSQLISLGAVSMSEATGSGRET